MGRAKQARIGDVQREYINSLRAELLQQAGSIDQMDMSFTEGVNLGIVIGQAFLHAPAYRDRATVEDETMALDDAAADLVALYILDNDVPEGMKRNYRRTAEDFAGMVVKAMMYDDAGQPPAEWIDEHSQPFADYEDLFTAEPPADDGEGEADDGAE